MVNALRTLLLNRDGTDNPGPDFPGEEFVPPAFRAQTLPASLAPIHQSLFGTDSDRSLVNWRLRSYLGLIHATPLSDYITALDPRITYLPVRADLFDLVAAGPRATVVMAADGQTLSLLAAAPAAEFAGRIRARWRLDVTDGANVAVRREIDDTGHAEDSVVAYTVADNVSSPIPLPGSSVVARFTPGVGAAWVVDLLSQPARSTADILVALDASLGPSQVDGLFGVDPPEPYRTFRNLWETHEQPPYRLGGLVLALGYRLQELRG